MAITISGENNNDRITAQDGVIDTISGFNIAGIITASSFTGDLTGDVTGNLTGNVTGNVNNTSNLLLQIGGTEKLRLNSDRVIIGQTLSNNQPSYNTSTTFVTTHTNNPGAWNAIAIVSGNSTGASFVKFGDRDDEDVSQIGHYNSDNSLRFYTNGSNERARITSDGKFGVGDFSSGTAVSQAFHVKGSEPKIYLEHTGGYDMTLTTSDGAGNNGITVNGGALSLAYNNKNIWMCRTGGYVSIGHMSPATRLDVKQNNGVAYNNRVQNVAYGAARFFNESGHVSGGTYTGLQFNLTGDSQNRICSIGMISEASNSRNSSLVFATDDNGNRTEKLRITSAGRVGVNTSVLTQQFVSYAAAGYPVLANGTSNGIGLGGNGAIVFGTKDLGSYGPGILDASTLEIKISGSPKLNIDSSGRVQIGASNNTGSNTKFVIGFGNNINTTALINTGDVDTNALTLSNWDGATTTNKVMIAFDNSGNGGFDIGMPAGSGDFAFQASGGERLRITSAGNVGVNVTDPDQKLEVDGIIKGSSYFQAGASGTASNNWHFGAEGNGEFRVYSGNYGAGDEKVRITSGGDTELRNIVSGINNSYSQYLKFRTTQSNGQSAITGAIRAQGKSGWGGDLVFYSKPANSTPNDTVSERLRIGSDGNVKIGSGTAGGKLHIGDIGSGDIVAELTSGSPMFTYRNGSGSWFHAGKHPTRDDFLISLGASTTTIPAFSIEASGSKIKFPSVKSSSVHQVSTADVEIAGRHIWKRITSQHHVTTATNVNHFYLAFFRASSGNQQTCYYRGVVVNVTAGGNYDWGGHGYVTHTSQTLLTFSGTTGGRHHSIINSGYSYLQNNSANMQVQGVGFSYDSNYLYANFRFYSDRSGTGWKPHYNVEVIDPSQCIYTCVAF